MEGKDPPGPTSPSAGGAGVLEGARTLSRRGIPRVLVIGIVAGLVVGGGVGFGWWYEDAIGITSGCGTFGWSIDYEGTSQGYLFVVQEAGEGPGINATCDAVSFYHVHPGAHMNGGLDLRNADREVAHTIDSVSVPGPFTLLSVSPSLPTTVAPNSTLILNFVFQAPSTPGSYTFEPSGTVGTT